MVNIIVQRLRGILNRQVIGGLRTKSAVLVLCSSVAEHHGCLIEGYFRGVFDVKSAFVSG